MDACLRAHPLNWSPVSSCPLQLQPFSCSRLPLKTSSYSSSKHSLITTHDDRDELQETVFNILSRRGVVTWLISSIVVASGQCLHARAEIEGNGKDELEIIHLELRKVLKKSKAAGILRLSFHDAGTFSVAKHTGGMNGSIVHELGRPENSGLDRTIKVLDMVKASLDNSIQVSWADLIAVAGAEAVAICGGPKIPVQLGRLDSVSADPEGELPAESFNASRLKKSFLGKGFRTQELVALSGAHTLGNKGFGNPVVFDNSYFKVLLEKPWLNTGDQVASMIGLPSDRALVDDDECLRWISYYAKDESKFFEDFSAAYVKLVNTGVMWRSRHNM